MARGPPKLCQISRKSATKGWGWGQRPSIFLVWICCLQRRGWGLAWAPYSHRAPRFLVWHVTQVNIWLERILDSSTTHFDQVLPNKIFLKCQKYGIFYYNGAFWVGCGSFSSLVKYDCLMWWERHCCHQKVLTKQNKKTWKFCHYTIKNTKSWLRL